jgi:hypothetical protein
MGNPSVTRDQGQGTIGLTRMSRLTPGSTGMFDQYSSLSANTISPGLGRLLGYLLIEGFAHNRPEVPEAQISNVRAHATTLRHLLSSFPAGMIIITGHCDATGEESYNQQLGLQRANGVKGILLQNGIDSSRIISQSKGEKELRVQTDQAHQRNRRVEIRFMANPAGTLVPRLQLHEPQPTVDLSLPPNYQVLPPPWLRFPHTGPSREEHRPSWNISPTLLGLVITINPQPESTPEEVIGNSFREHNLNLTSEELQTLLQSRTKGVEQLKVMLKKIAPTLNEQELNEYSNKIATALMNESLNNQLRREHPTLFEREQQREEQIEQQLGIPQPGLTPTFTLKINF